MTDSNLPEPTTPPPNGAFYERKDKAELAASIRKSRMVSNIILSGWVLTLVTMVAIVGTALTMMLRDGFTELPKELATWGGIALGFLFSTFSKVLSDYISTGGLKQD